MEGSTDVPLLRALLQRLYGASCESKLKVARPMALDEPFDAKRSKYHVQGQILGLCDAVGGPRAMKMIRTLATLSNTGGFPSLRRLVLVRDLDKGEAPDLHEELTQDLQRFASGEDAAFELQNDGPWLCRVHNIVVGQILLGDPSTPGTAAIEDHMLEFLKYQPDRDPSEIIPVVGNHLRIDPSPKQRVLLAMVRDRYWTAAARFYDNVLESASDDQIKSLADQIRFTELMKRLTGEQPEG